MPHLPRFESGPRLGTQTYTTQHKGERYGCRPYQRRPRQNRTTDAGSNNKGGDNMAQNPSDHADNQASRSLDEYLDKAHASANSPRVRQALAELKPAFKY